jgi:hypothetical protein
MDYAAKYQEVVAWCRTRAAKAVLLLCKAMADLSTKLSIVAVLGIGAIAIIPQQAASTLRRSNLAGGAPAIEIVRPKQVIIDEAEQPEGVELIAGQRQRRKFSEPERSAPVRKDSAIAVEPEPIPVPEPPAGSAQIEPPKPEVWSDAEVISALRDCVKLLAPISAEVELAQPVKQDQCGSAAPVMLRRVGGNRVEINPPAMVNCAMVVHLHEWVTKVLQPAAEETFGSPITRLANASGYSCRNRNGSPSHGERLSEHALANAIDIAGFVTADGRSIEVGRYWGPTRRDQSRLTTARGKEGKEAASKSEAKTTVRTPSAISRPLGDRRKREDGPDGSYSSAQLHRLGRSEVKRDSGPAPAVAREEAQTSTEGAFLRRLHKGACGIFSTVLGPEANEAHRDHFHLDLAPRRRGSFCE